MSGKMIGLVFDCDIDPELKYVFLALADHADHDGENIRPGIGLIAWKTGSSVRAIQYSLRKLEQAGYIERVTNGIGGRGRKTEYRMILDALPVRHTRDLKDAGSAGFKGRKRVQDLHPSDDLKGATKAQERVQLRPEKTADTSEREPSEEPSVSSVPSGTRKRSKKTKPATIDDMPRNGPAQTFVAIWAERSGSMPGSYERALGNAASLARAGVDEAELNRLYDWLAGNSFYDDKGFDIATAVTQLDKFRSATKPKRKATGGPVTRSDGPRPAWETLGGTEEQWQKGVQDDR